MTEGFTYDQHPRVAEREKQGPPTVKKTVTALTESPVGRFNRKVGLAITTSVGTMWCAYAFTAIALISLPAALSSGNAIVIISWIAQTFLQLALLPVIIVGQNIQGAASDARAAATYDDAGAILDEARQIQAHLIAQDAAIGVLLEKTLALEKSIALAK